MSFHIHQLYFSPSPWSLSLGLFVVVAMVVMARLSYLRSPRKPRHVWLERLRVIICLVAVLLLWKPEWHTVVEPRTLPRVVVLTDESRSMNTLDALLPATAEQASMVVERRELAEKVKALPQWAELERAGQWQARMRGFSAEPSDEAQRAMAGTDFTTPLRSVLDEESNLRAVLLVSDGDWNLGEPPVSVAQQYRLRGVPIFAVAAGSKTRFPDLELLPIRAPSYGIVGENIQIPFSIRSSLDREVRCTVRLRDQSGQERSKAIVIPAQQTMHDALLWRLEKQGTSELELSLPVATGERVPQNNARRFTMAAKPEKIRVLLIDSLPRWEYRYLRNALMRDPGVDVACLLFHPQLGVASGGNYLSGFPEKREELSKYDVIMLGDVGLAPGQLTVEQCQLIRGMVENQASGLVFLPGAQGNQLSLEQSPLADLLPVTYDSSQRQGLVESLPAPLALTTEGTGSLLLMLADREEDNAALWRSLPGFFWHAGVAKAKAGTSVLAVHANRSSGNQGRVPLIVTQSARAGKVLFMGIDSAWRWRRGVEDKYHYRFWGQVARWMSYQRNMAAGQRVRLYYTPERPLPGDRVMLHANAFDAQGAPLQQGLVNVSLNGPDGSSQFLTLQQDDSGWGAYAGAVNLGVAGAWKLKAWVDDDRAGVLETTILAQYNEREQAGQPARPEVLEEIGRVTQGRLLQVEQIPAWLQEIQARPQPQRLEKRLALWSHPWVVSLFIAALGLFWWGRKRSGQF